MDEQFLSMGIFLEWFQNISILVMLVLFYNFIPDRVFVKRGLAFSLLTGVIFSFAALMGILIPSSLSPYPVIGFNGVLVPLAGYIGGPVSAVLVTSLLLLIKQPVIPGAGFSEEFYILVSAAVIGSFFFFVRNTKRVHFSYLKGLFLLSLIFSGVCICIAQSSTPKNQYQSIINTAEVALIIFFGLFVLGMVIQLIDQKKQSTRDLLTYKDHLELLVRERTAELEEINALQEATIESTADAIFVIDFSGIIYTWNQSGERYLELVSPRKEEQSIFSLFQAKLVNPESVLEQLRTMPYDHEPILRTDLVTRSGGNFEMYISPYRVKDAVMGRVINLREITDRKRAEESLQVANQKLLLLSSITRHDILNLVTALELYLNEIQDSSENPTIHLYVQKMQQVLKSIQQHLSFTSDYQDLGLKSPIWQNPAVAFRKASESFSTSRIRFASPTEEIEIFADPLLERVFYNLIDNSLRHGEAVSHIALSYQISADDLVIWYEDDGVGVLPEEKDKIFIKGFGKHTGFGMFLIHEILSITGITIQEQGVYGKGVRFVITVQKGKFRKYEEPLP